MRTIVITAATSMLCTLVFLHIGIAIIDYRREQRIAEECRHKAEMSIDQHAIWCMSRDKKNPGGEAGAL